MLLSNLLFIVSFDYFDKLSMKRLRAGFAQERLRFSYLRTTKFDLGLLALRPCPAGASDMQSEISMLSIACRRLPAACVYYLVNI